MKSIHSVETNNQLTRRQALGALGIAGAASAMTACATMRKDTVTASTFRYCLNMSTIRGQKLSAAEEVDVAGISGYDGIEPWMGKLRQYVEGGGSLEDLRKRIEDYGMTVESAIGFAAWIVDDPEKRKKGFEDAKRDMELLAKIGGKRIAAPPAGVPRGKLVEPQAAAERYRQLLELGEQTGVIPQIEMWGGNESIGKVSTAVFVAVESGHPDACFLGDVFHTYKGGSDFDSLRLLSPQALQVFHLNDYPASPPQKDIRDEHRVYPGDGIAPITKILDIFQSVGASPTLSLELFNREYWKKNALDAAQIGLAKMRQAVAQATV